MTQTNSRGKAPSQKHLDSKDKELAYLDEVRRFLDERNKRPNPSWTEDDARRYKEIWEKHHGPLEKKKPSCQ